MLMSLLSFLATFMLVVISKNKPKAACNASEFFSASQSNKNSLQGVQITNSFADSASFICDLEM